MVPLRNAPTTETPRPRVSPAAGSGVVKDGEGKGGLTSRAVPGATPRSKPRATPNTAGEDEQWVSTFVPPRIRERCVKAIRQALHTFGVRVVALHAAGCAFSLFTGPLSPALRAQLARPMVLTSPAGIAAKLSRPLARLNWERVKPAGERENRQPAAESPAPLPALLQSGLWRMFNSKCARADSAPDLLGAGQRLRAMGLQVAEARVCVVHPNAAWGEGLAAAGGRRGVEFLLRASPAVLAAAHGLLAAGLELPCVGGGPTCAWPLDVSWPSRDRRGGNPARPCSPAGASEPPRRTTSPGPTHPRGSRGAGAGGPQAGAAEARDEAAPVKNPPPAKPLGRRRRRRHRHLRRRLPRVVAALAAAAAAMGRRPGGGEAAAGGNDAGGGGSGDAPSQPDRRPQMAQFRDDSRDFVFVEGLRHGAANNAPRVRNFPGSTELELYREMVQSALPVNHLDILDAWLTPTKLGAVRLRCSLGVAASLSGNRFDLGLLGIWSLMPRGPKPGAPADHDATGHFAIDAEHLMEARAGSTASEGRPAVPPRLRVGAGSVEFGERRTAFLHALKSDLQSLGMAILTLPFLPGEETRTEGPFYPLAGSAEMPHVRAAVAQRPAIRPTFAHITLRQTLAAASTVAVAGGKVHSLQLAAHLMKGDNRPFPIDPRSFVDQIMTHPTAAARNPVCLGDRAQIGAALDTTPWGSQTMVISIPGLEPDGCQLLAALDTIKFKDPNGAVIRLAWGAAISDKSGLRRRLERWFQEGKRTNGDRPLPAEESAGYATPVRGLFLDANGRTQGRLREEFGRDGLVDFDGTIRRRTGGQGTLSFAPTTPPKRGAPAAAHSFGRTHGGSSHGGNRKKSGRKKAARPGFTSSDSSASSGGEGAGGRPRRKRQLAGDFGGAAGQGGNGADEIILDVGMSDEALALLPPDSQPSSSKLTVSRDQERAVTGVMQLMNSFATALLTQHATALKASEARQNESLTAAVDEMKVHTNTKVEAESKALRLAFHIDEEAAAEHATKVKALRDAELAAAEAARTRAEEARDRRLKEEEAADAAAAAHANMLKAARDDDALRLRRRKLLTDEEDQLLLADVVRRREEAASPREASPRKPARRPPGGPPGGRGGQGGAAPGSDGGPSDAGEGSSDAGENGASTRATRHAAREAARAAAPADPTE